MKIDNVVKRHEEALQSANEELTKICKSWTNLEWDELEWNRIKELTTRDNLERRKQEATKLQGLHCLDCANFVKHVSTSLLHALIEIIN